MLRHYYTSFVIRGNYDRVIVDTDVCSDEIRDTLFELADCVVMIADGTEIGRNKLQNKLFELQKYQ